jgi:hypothetical protein
MTSQFPPRPKPVTWSHIEMCRWELERLRGVIFELNNYIEKSRKYLEEASAFVEGEDSSPSKALPPGGGRGAAGSSPQPPKLNFAGTEQRKIVS